jgi:alkanesulfonate monooxygenase SsuD/methylene tetrahydromethanopterin reductase-like flavin-dependent oxidoreductase (luciferase family)
MLRLAGEVADGVFLWLVGETATREAIGIVTAAAAGAGRSRAEITTGCLVPACVDTDGDAARRAMRTHLLEFYLARGVYSDVLARAGFAEAGERVKALVARGEREDAAASIPDEALDELAIAGSPDDCRARLSSWYARGLDLVVLYVFPVDGDWPSAYRRIVADLGPGA